jgi:hypothetical protein
MLNRLGIVACALAVIACSHRGPQHAAMIDCESPDKGSHGPTWCAASLDKFLGAHPDVELDTFSVTVDHVGNDEFGSIVLLYRGDLPILGEENGSAKK